VSLASWGDGTQPASVWSSFSMSLQSLVSIRGLGLTLNAQHHPSMLYCLNNSSCFGRPCSRPAEHVIEKASCNLVCCVQERLLSALHTWWKVQQ
jgi:hypothetical protein